MQVTHWSAAKVVWSPDDGTGQTKVERPSAVLLCDCGEWLAFPGEQEQVCLRCGTRLTVHAAVVLTVTVESPMFIGPELAVSSAARAEG